MTDAGPIEELQQLAAEQGALRRIAELAARGASPEQVLDAIVHEATALLETPAASLMRFEPDGAAVLMAVHGAPPEIPLGTRVAAGGDGVLHRVHATHRTVRLEGPEEYEGLPGDEPAIVREAGITGSVAAPIFVDAALWGCMTIASFGEPLPASLDERMTRFAALVGTAIGGAQARSELHALAEEQAALRRVAEIVARGATPERVLDVVVEEASDLLEGAGTALMRYEPDGEGVMVAVCRSQAPLGLRVPPIPGMATDQILRTGSAVRVDRFADTPLAEIAGEIGVASGVGVPIVVEGSVWGMLSVGVVEGPLPAGAEERLTQFAGLAGVAIANALSRAELAASRARVVTAADESRRRLQRDVHDGAQQRLVQAVITLKLAQEALGDVPGPGTELVAEGLLHAERASAELRDLVRGILPASLTRGGLRAGVDSLVRDMPLAVTVDVGVERLSPGLETTAYFVVAEALANVVKHAGATRAGVRIAPSDGALLVEVADDGAGGADPLAGSGLTGLFDRVEAGGGTLTITSPPGAGTTIRALLAPAPA